MKKFISAACIIALIALVPAVFVGYLHNDTSNKNKTEVVKDDVTTGHEESGLLRLVKTF